MIYAIGDIHGQVTMLTSLLATLKAEPLQESDTLLFLGDYIDRGENSCAVIETLLELRKERTNVIFLRGNHEQLMLEARNGPAPTISDDGETLVLSDAIQIWLANGGVDTLVSYQEELKADDLLRWWEIIPASHWEFIRATELEHITTRYHFVHAGLLPIGRTWEGADMGLIPQLWIREPFLSHRGDFNGRVVVFGHTPQRTGRALIQRNKIGLDTGAVFGGPLTAAVLDPESTARRLPTPHFIQTAHVNLSDE